MKKICAWCGLPLQSSKKTKTQKNDLASHGICKACAKIVFK